MTSARASHLLNAAWLEAFLANWNANSEARNAFRGVGWVDFVEDAGDGPHTLHVFWNEDGAAVAGSPPGGARPTFRAPSEVWAAFLAGSLDPMLAVLGGQIAYRGPVAFAFRYGGAFKHVHLVMHVPECRMTHLTESATIQDQSRRS
jgi:hypothetical protein